MSKPIKPKKKISFNPLEGQFDLTTDNNFSYVSTPLNKRLLIATNHQMIVSQEFIVDGEIIIDGELVVID